MNNQLVKRRMDTAQGHRLGITLFAFLVAHGVALAQQVAPDAENLFIFRAADCQYLLETGPRLKAAHQAGDASVYASSGNARLDRANREAAPRWELAKAQARAALAQVLGEKQCDKQQAASAPAASVGSRPVAPALVAPAVQSGVGALPQIGVKVDAVSSGFAQSLGLKQVGGALVVEAEPGGMAQKAGLQALDVILEITGQQVQTPADLQESLSRMRPGFKAPMRVWRNKAMRELVVEVGAGFSEDALTARAVVAGALPLPAALPQASTPSPRPDEAYCIAQVSMRPDMPMVSHVFALPATNGTVHESDVKSNLIEFHNALRPALGERFQEVSANEIRCGLNACFADVGGGLFAVKQQTIIQCKADRSTVENRFLKRFDWQPKR